VKRRTFLTLIGGTAVAVVAAGFGAQLTGADVAELRLGLGRRVVFISDLHLHGVRRLDLPPYDLLLIGGDTYDEKTPSLDVVVETLRRLPGPKVAVLGNHEHWSRRKFPLRQGG
jgi:Predicted phosphohydrolases